MHRNLDRRVEALVRVTDRTARAELEDLLTRSMSDDVTAFELGPDGTWTAPKPGVAPGAAGTPSASSTPAHLQEALLKSVVG